MSTKITSVISNTVLGIPVIHLGTRLLEPNGAYAYDVAPACSVIRSLTAIIAFSMVYGFITFKTMWRRGFILASAIPLGSRVKLQTKAGRRLTATLMSVSDEAVIVQRASRVPEPAMTVPFGELARLQRDERNGFSVGKAIGIGLASGAGAILTLFAIAMSIDD